MGKRDIPLWFRLLRYKQDGNKDFAHVKGWLKFLHKILTPYEFDVTILTDRGFKSIDLFCFIDDIILAKGDKKYFYNIKLTEQEYIYNMALCK